MVYVRTSTISSIQASVDKGDGAVVIRNETVRRWEGKDRLRLVRLQAVRAQIVRRGLRTFPDRLRYSSEGSAFAVYRPELLIVDAGVLASDAKTRQAFEYIMDALNKTTYQQYQVSEHLFVRALLKVAPAHPEIHWKFKRPDAGT